MTKRPKNTHTTATTTPAPATCKPAAAPAPASVKHKTPQEQESAHHHAVITNAVALQHSLQAATNRSGEEAVLLRRVIAFLSHDKAGAS